MLMLRRKKKSVQIEGIEPDVNRTRNLLIWSQTRYHCATDPMLSCLCNKYLTGLHLVYSAKSSTIPIERKKISLIHK